MATEQMWIVQELELDVAYDDALEHTLATIPEDIRVTYRVAMPTGPGGGWPVIAFHGVRSDLERLVREWYSPDDLEHAEYLLTGEDT